MDKRFIDLDFRVQDTFKALDEVFFSDAPLDVARVFRLGSLLDRLADRAEVLAATYQPVSEPGRVARFARQSAVSARRIERAALRIAATAS